MHLWNTYSTTGMSLQSFQERNQLHTQHKTCFCTPLVTSQCTAEFCNHEELRFQSDEYEQFLLCSGRLPTCQGEICHCRAIFLNNLGAELSRCSVPQAHQRNFHCCTRISQTLECRSLQSSFLESTPPLHHSDRLHRHDSLAPIYFPPQIRPNSEEVGLNYCSPWILLLQTSHRLSGKYPRRPSPHHYISLTVVIERRHQYRVLLRGTTPISASSDIIYVAIVNRRLL